MNGPGSKRLAETVSSAASMTLFLIFSMCCLIIITVAASAYGRISGNYDNTFNSAAAVRYITNKIRASGETEVISESELLLRDDGYVTVIYHSEGAVWERLYPEGESPVASGGERMFSAEKLLIEESEGAVRVTAEDGGSSFTAYCRGSLS
ncbi:MAG: DUF4860 domain-containing protein [Oscillospiraceae bacterium]|nr:DUF4860 domain-containing protein [Oscillospiraceae bacterium]